MTKPTWVKVIGILGIIFGCLGIIGSLNLMIMPKVMSFQQELMEVAMEEARNDPNFPEKLADKLAEWWDLPSWYQTWAIVFGAVNLLLGAFYLLAAIWLIQVKPSGDKIMIWALGISILVAILQVVTIIPAGTFMAIMLTFGCTISIVIDLVLLIVILTSDRTIFRKDAAAGVT